jgi:hypothetical protein
VGPLLQWAGDREGVLDHDVVGGLVGGTTMRSSPVLGHDVRGAGEERERPLESDPIAELRQRVEDLELMCGVTQAPEFIPAMQAFGLTATEARLACLLFKLGFVSRTRAHHHLYGDADCSPATLRVTLARLRARLEPHGIQIETVHGEGWQMGHEAKERFSAQLAPVRT